MWRRRRSARRGSSGVVTGNLTTGSSPERARALPTGFIFFSSRRRHTRWNCDWSSDVCSSDLDRGLPTHHVQGAQDLRPDWFVGVNSVGLTAGTSTLDETIDGVHRALLLMGTPG